MALLQRGVVVIPKSTHIERMQQNLNVFDFELTEEEMNAIAESVTQELHRSFHIMIRQWLNGLPIW